MATKKKEYEILEFYGGRARIEKVPYGDYFRYRKIGEKSYLISSTKVTGHLDKSSALIPWACGVVASHMTNYVETSTSETFTREEMMMVATEARGKPDEAKVKGGDTGSIIHDFAYDFSRSKTHGTPAPTLDHINEEDPEGIKALNGINAFLEWYNTNRVEFIKAEYAIYYNSFLAGDTKEGETVIEYIGIIDCVARVNGRIFVIDYKSSKGIYDDQRFQVSSYVKGWNTDRKNGDKEMAEGMLLLNFNKETGEAIIKEYSLEEVRADFDLGFRGLYLAALRVKELAK